MPLWPTPQAPMACLFDCPENIRRSGPHDRGANAAAATPPADRHAISSSNVGAVAAPVIAQTAVASSAAQYTRLRPNRSRTSLPAVSSQRSRPGKPTTTKTPLPSGAPNSSMIAFSQDVDDVVAEGAHHCSRQQRCQPQRCAIVQRAARRPSAEHRSCFVFPIWNPANCGMSHGVCRAHYTHQTCCHPRAWLGNPAGAMVPDPARRIWTTCTSGLMPARCRGETLRHRKPGDMPPTSSRNVLHMVRQFRMCTVVVDPGRDRAEHSTIDYGPQQFNEELQNWTPITAALDLPCGHRRHSHHDGNHREHRVAAVTTTLMTAWAFSGPHHRSPVLDLQRQPHRGRELFNIFLIIAIVTAMLGARFAGNGRRPDDGHAVPLGLYVPAPSGFIVLAIVTYVISLFFSRRLRCPGRRGAPYPSRSAQVTAPLSSRHSHRDLRPGHGPVLGLHHQEWRPASRPRPRGVDNNAVTDKAMVLSLIVD